MMKTKDYKTPVAQVVNLKMHSMLMALSGNTSSAETLNSGKLNARGSSGFWDDDDDE